MQKQRARNEDGHYIADDPTTPQNEAWVEQEPTTAKAKRKVKQSQAPKKEAASPFTYFVSAGEESSVFDLRVGDVKVRGSWDTGRTHVFWKVPADIVSNAMKHHHIWSGRIIPAEDD